LSSLVILGTASHSGKSAIVAGLCRLLRRRGLAVAPFKAQNMALNSFVTASGGEIGRAQAMQAEAAGLEPQIEMNPILLKPSDGRIQVVLKGKVFGTMTADEYYRQKPLFVAEVLECHRRLAREFDVIVVEGAGSAIEVNLADRDIVNLPLARLIDSPCLLVADIDRGGIFASVVGTCVLCDPDDRARIRGFIVNKFRGERSLFTDGIEFLEARTGWSCMGVVPHLDWLKLDEEDSVALDSRPIVRPAEPGGLSVAVIRLPHISNYTDFAPIEQSNAVVSYVDRTETLLDADLIVIPGTKNTLADLLWLKSRGFEDVLKRRHAHGAAILGICGGYQMLGAEVRDPHGVESEHQSVRGIGLLDVETSMAAEKTTRQVEAVHPESGRPVRGYEIHMGRTNTNAGTVPFLRVFRRGSERVDEPDGACSEGVFGTYIHGLFDNREFAEAFLRSVATCRGKTFTLRSSFFKEQLYDRWADVLEQELRLDRIQECLGRPLRSDVSVSH
jgi:adenosylcobyric acid synthase